MHHGAVVVDHAGVRQAAAARLGLVAPGAAEHTLPHAAARVPSAQRLGVAVARAGLWVAADGLGVGVHHDLAGLVGAWVRGHDGAPVAGHVVGVNL